MIDKPSTPVNKTPLFDWHIERGARLIDFGGWVMPLQYTGIIEEHRNTRENASLFDVCHMGEIEVTGEGALSFLQYVLTRDIGALKVGKMKLSLLLNEKGGIMDDLTVYALGENYYRLVTNAATKDKVLAWLCLVRDNKEFKGVEIRDVSLELGKIDLQGPRSEEILETLCDGSLKEIGYYCFREMGVNRCPALISRSGYTGEDGFEIYLAVEDTPLLWEAIMDAGRGKGLLPAGLGARDTLRMEAGLMLYGNDIDESVNPFEVPYEWAVDLGKDFVGRDALLKLKADSLNRKLVGFVMEGKGLARHGYAVLREGVQVGVVTSGTYAPSLNRAIGMAFVSPDLAREGAQLEIDIRGNSALARVVKLPFYKKIRKEGVGNGKGKS